MFHNLINFLTSNCEAETELLDLLCILVICSTAMFAILSEAVARLYLTLNLADLAYLFWIVTAGAQTIAQHKLPTTALNFDPNER